MTHLLPVIITPRLDPIEISKDGPSKARVQVLAAHSSPQTGSLEFPT